MCFPCILYHCCSFLFMKNIVFVLYSWNLTCLNHYFYKHLNLSLFFFFFISHYTQVAIETKKNILEHFLLFIALLRLVRFKNHFGLICHKRKKNIYPKNKVNIKCTFITFYNIIHTLNTTYLLVNIYERVKLYLKK